MILMRRRLMATYVGTLLHRWRGNRPFQGELWQDEVRTHHPIDWDVKSASQYMGYVITQGWVTLTTQGLADEREDFGKFFSFEIEIDKFLTAGGSSPRYIIDIGTNNQNPYSIACAVYYQEGKMHAKFRILNGTEINSISLGLDGIPYDITSQGAIRFGVKNDGAGGGQFLLEQKDGARSVSSSFNMPYIGRDIRWSSDYALIGRTYNVAYGDTFNPLAVKQISIYRL